MLEMYGYIDGQLKDVREALCKQAVHNQRTEDSFTLVKQDVDCCPQGGAGRREDGGRAPLLR